MTYYVAGSNGILIAAFNNFFASYNKCNALKYTWQNLIALLTKV